MTGMDFTAIAAAPRIEPLPRLKRRITVPAALLIAAVGGAVHMAALELIERYVRTYPSVPDVAQASLPYVNFGLAGELTFVAILAAAILVLLVRQPRTLPGILAMIGIFYAIRGVFLFAFPIGAPPTAPLLANRLAIYPFAGHSYFPGGHAGLMTILSLSMTSPRWRATFLSLTALFALGTVIARTHYIADVMGGALVGYAVLSWVRSHFEIGDRARPAIAPAPLRAVPTRTRLEPLLP